MVHIFGFPVVLEGFENIHSVVIPAYITGQDRQHLTLSCLSSPGLSGAAIICTVYGCPIGYLGGGLDSSCKNEQYQSYGYPLYGIKGIPREDEESQVDCRNLDRNKYTRMS